MFVDRYRRDYEFGGGEKHLFLPDYPANFGVIPVERVVGQACLIPNWRCPTIPPTVGDRACPGGRADGRGGAKGDPIFLVNVNAMQKGRSFEQDFERGCF